MSSTLSPLECCASLSAPVLTQGEAEAAATVYAALASPARVRIVHLLGIAAEAVCLCELVEPLGLAQATVSQHLRKLVDAGLVEREERGKWSFFSIKREAMAQVAALAHPKGVCC